MAATAFLDLLRKNPNFGSQTFSTRGLLATKLVGIPASAATSFAVAVPFAFGSLFVNVIPAVAYCDAGMAPVEEDFGEDFISGIGKASQNIFHNDALKYTMKHYDVQLKPLFSAFHWKILAMTSLRSFLLFYLHLLEPHPRPEDEDDDFLQEDSEENRVDLVTPFHKSVKQIIRECVLLQEEFLKDLQFIMFHSAWPGNFSKMFRNLPFAKLEEDCRLSHPFTVSREPLLEVMQLFLPFFLLFVLTSIHQDLNLLARLSFISTGHFLGVLALWIVQVGIDIYRFFNSLYKSREEGEEGDQIDTSEQVHILRKKVYGTTVRCASSLVFASIGAGIGATMFRPSTGQWMGCAVGDLAGPIVVGFCFEKLHLHL